MESTVLSVGKSVLNGALGYAKSAVAEEVALQLGIQRDHAFIRDELEMMQAFLMAAHDERDENKVIKTWVKQVRDVAYDVEDSLQDFAVRLEKPSCWCSPRTLSDRRRVAKQMKELRAKVEDVSQRNVRYRLIKGPGSQDTAAAGQSRVAGATMSAIDEAKRQQDNAKEELVQLIKKKGDDLRVIALWGTSGDLGDTSIIKRAYEDPKVHKEFECRAWIRLTRPFNPTEFLQSIVRKFYENSIQKDGEREKATLGTLLRRMGMVKQDNLADAFKGYVLKRMGMMKKDDLADAFKGYVNEKSYLIVLYDLSTIDEWDQIKTYFPNNKKGSRIIVSTEQVDVASLCVGPESAVPEHIQLCADQTLYAFYQKGSQDVTDSTGAGPSSNNSADRKTKVAALEKADHARDPFTKKGSEEVTDYQMNFKKIVSPFKESELVGRVNEKYEIIKLISKESQQLEVISVCGMGGLGKTTLVNDVYQSQELSGKFEKRACVTVMRPFNKEELLKSLAVQLYQKSPGKPETQQSLAGLLEGGKTKSKDQQWLTDLLEGKKYLIVLDDLSSTTEWDAIFDHFPKTQTESRIIVTTREESIAKHCSGEQISNIYKLKYLEDEFAKDLFTKKVFKKAVHLDEQYPDLAEEAKLILKKCKGLPLAIVTIGGFLANQPKTAVEWRKLNEHISAELQMNPKLGKIRTVLEKSYDGLPYHLKSCFLYLSIFPEDQKVSRKRLARRWTAEGYSTEVHDRSGAEVADNYFLELKERSMILPTQKSMYSRKVIDSCQVHDLMRDIGISKSMEESLVFRLEEGCSSSSPRTIRHLAITSRSWEGDDSEFESIVDLSRVRSLTVFGHWRPFFISEKTRLLRVLDLEDTDGLRDHHLEHIAKLLHLKYLSLRGCGEIFYLPESFGNLRLLETLDVTDTRIVRLPKTIINLQKLNYLRAGQKPWDEDVSYEQIAEEVPKLIRNKLCLLTLGSMVLCALCSVAPVLHTNAMNSRDVCTMGCCALLPVLAMRLEKHGVVVPRGMRKLKALHTLGVVNIARGKDVLQDIKGFTQLRKLGVTGVNKKNGQELCSAIADLRRLESLSVRSEGEPGLHCCLDVDGTSSPPENLESLKLYGNLVKLPEWIAGLKNLVKLKLRSTRLSEPAAAMQVLGNLPNLAILRLWSKSFEGEELHFQREGFGSLLMLELHRLEDIESVKFDQGAMPKLELLQVRDVWREDEISFSGLEFLPSIKEVLLNVSFAWRKGEKKAKLKEDKLKERLRAQLAKNPKQPILSSEVGRD